MGVYLTLPIGSEEPPTAEELMNVPILKDKEVDPGALDGRDKSSTIDMLPNRTLEHTAQHTESGVYVGEGLPPFLKGWLKGS